MIFVTVGSAEKGIEFDRLIEEMDIIAGKIKEPVVMQVGSSRYVPKNAASFSYKNFTEILGYFQKAKLVVGHCGSGTVLNAFRFGIPLVVVPRTRALREVDSDEHQTLLARKIESHPGVRVVYRVEDLSKAVEEMLALDFPSGLIQQSQERDSLLGFLTEWVLK